jgi:uncharacterized protein YmfQ (DUF2313 family)
MSQPAEVYARMLKQLLPRGAAWELEPGDVRTQVLQAIADALARVDARADELMEEIDPRTSLELLEDWERLVGLPDDVVTEIPSDIIQRRIAIITKLLARGGASRAYFIGLAAAMGFLVTITEYGPLVARVGKLRVGERIYGSSWAYVWQVNVDLDSPALSGWAPTVEVLRVGIGRVGQRLRSRSGTLLEGVFRKLKPAHTIVQFSYS